MQIVINQWIHMIWLQHSTTYWFIHLESSKSPQITDLIWSYIYILHLCIYQMLLSKATYIQAIYFLSVCVSLGIDPMTFYAANAMLYHWATGTMVLIKMISVIIHINIRLRTGEWSISNSQKIYFWYFQSSRNVKVVILLEWYIIRIFVH